MRKSVFHLLGKGVGNVVSYKRLVEISNKLNFTLVLPLKSSIQITLHCNSKCGYCDMWKLTDSRNLSYTMSLEAISRVFDSFSRLGVRVVSLTGGEPLIHKNINEIIRSAKHHRLWIDLSTNGISLTKDRALELAEAGIQCINLSLDTLDAKTYERHRGVPFSFAQRALRSLSYVVNEYPAVGGTVNCVVTRHNISELADFVKGITEYGKSRITITFQPYHPPPRFSEISCELDQEMTKRLWSCFKDRPPENLAPRDGLKQSLEKEIQKLVNLKREGFPIRNSEIYLRRIPEFLMDGKLPRDFSCIAGYTGFFMRYDLKVLPCYRLPPAGDACKEDLAEIWFSGKYRRQRKKMKRLFCHGCMFLCYNDPGCLSSAMTWKFYDCIYKRHDIPGKH